MTEPLFALSNTTPGVVYQLRRGPTGWECACPGFYYRKECHHVLMVMVSDHRTPMEGIHPQRIPVSTLPLASEFLACLQCQVPVPVPGLKECHHVKNAPASVLDVRTPDGTKRERDTVLPEVQPDHGVEPECPQCRTPVPSPGECVNCLLFPYGG